MTQLEHLLPEFIALIRKLFIRGTSAFLIVFGRRETGKTDFALLIAEILWELGIIQEFATNIKIYKSPFPIKYITNLDDLRFWAANTPGKKLFLFDEFGKAMRRRTPMSSLNIKLIDDFQILRKHKLSTIAITIDEKYVDNTSLGSDILDGIFIKPNYQNKKFALYSDKLENFHKRISNIPGTSVDFDTWDVAPFTEHSPTTKPAFKDKDLEILWDLTHGKTMKDLGLFPTQVGRIWHKFVKVVLEKDYNIEHSLEREDTKARIDVIEPQI